MLLLSFDEGGPTTSLKFCKKRPYNGKLPPPGTITVPMPPDKNSPDSASLTSVADVPWVDGMGVSDLCDIGTMKMSGDAAVSRASSRPELLSVMGSFLDHGWVLTGSGANDLYLFEKVVEGKLIPPPPPVIETPPLPPPKTPGAGLSRKGPDPVEEEEDEGDVPSSPRMYRSISLTNEQETTNFKQKMIFGIVVKKIPHLPTAQSKDVTLRLVGSGRDLQVTWGSKKDGTIKVVDIVDVMASDKLSKKHSDKGKCFTITTSNRTLNLMASNQKQCFWFIRGFDGLIKVRQEENHDIFFDNEDEDEEDHDDSALLRKGVESLGTKILI